ncbi:general substrate transporter [Halenospora varia]|nr:general substrate transporter [Halenospora varia]
MKTMGFLQPKQPYFGLRGGWLTFWVTVACATDMTLFGYDQGVFGGVIVTPSFLEIHNLTGKTGLISTVTAIYDIGCFVGAVSACWLGEVLGRKKTVLTGTTIMTIGAIIQISSYSVAQMIIGRIVAGIGNGINTATAPVWQTETSQVKWRGKLVVIELIMNIFGFMVSNWMTFGFSYVASSASWRFPLAFQLIFIFILYATVPWLPESPRWLIAHEYEDEAFQILADLEDKDTNDPWILTQHKEIVFTVQYEREHAPKWSELLRGKTEEGETKTIRRLLLGAGTQFMQQFSGINVTSYYLPTVLIESVGLSNKMARLLAACNSVSYLLFSLIGVPNVERWGRRKMLMFAAAGQGFCYLIITILLRYSMKDGYAHQREVAEASIAFFFLYYVFFGIGMQGVPWLYPTEINSLAMRTKGAAIGAATNWMCNFIVVEITPPGIQNLRWRFYIIWIVFNLSFVPLVYFIYPETAGRTLEDLDAYYRTSPPLLVFRDKEVISSKRPQHFLMVEEEEVRRASNADPLQFRRESRIGSTRERRGSMYGGGRNIYGSATGSDAEKDVYDHREL